jgi:SAM-dependent methyltransferase
MAFKDHFSGLSSGYAEYRPRYPGELFDFLAGRCVERRLAWDCACGTGQASVSLAGRFEQVLATDASAKQIEAAEPHERVSYRVAEAEHSGLGPESVDLITVAQALHWFDLDAFYREAHRVLRPGGVIAAWCYGLLSIDQPEVDLAMRRFYRMLDPWWPPERALVDAGYRTMPFPFDELPVPSFEMRAGWSLPQLVGYTRTWSAVARYRSDRGEDPVARLEEEVRPAWGGAETVRAVTWPLALRVGRRESTAAAR